MVRRLIVTVALTVGASVYRWRPNERCPSLTDGERKSGPVVFHGDARENLINGYLNLGTDSRKDPFPSIRVAVIDFVGGRPQQTELQALPGEQRHPRPGSE